MKPEYLILHHSLTKDSKTVSWSAIRKYHIETLGWRDIGYHFGIEMVDIHPEIMVGRLWFDHGAHCRARGMNHRAIGICFVGNYDADHVPLVMWRYGIMLCRTLIKTFDIPKGNVVGHGEIDGRKSCPGNTFNLNHFRSQL